MHAGEFIPDDVVRSAKLTGVKRTPLEVEVPPGTAVLFDANLLHAVRPNDAADGRPSERLAFHFIPGSHGSAFRGTSFARGDFADRHLAAPAQDLARTRSGDALAQPSKRKRPGV